MSATKLTPIYPKAAVAALADDLLAEGLMTVKQACEFLQLSDSSIYELMVKGDLAFTKIGGARRIPRVAVKRLAARLLANVP